MSRLHGVIPPVVVPLTTDYQVDWPSYTRVLENLLAGGVHGLFVLGSTSEVTFHDDATRRRIVEHSVKVAAGRVPVVAGAIDAATDRVIAHAKDAEAAGAAAVVVTAPYYTRTSMAEVGDHFRYVRGAIGVPVIAYDIPVCVHIKLDRALINELARDGTIAALKDSSGDDANFRYVLSDLADLPDFSVMTGSEIVVDAVLGWGAHGVVPGLGNVDPVGYVKLWDAAQRGDWRAARAEQERLCRLFEIARQGTPRTSTGASGVGGFKTAMRRLGIITTNLMARPQRSLNDEEAARVDTILRATGLLG
jgi:4-hydroxy-tetrahydrodipicolinate synthase